MIVSCLYKIDVDVAKDIVVEIFNLFTLFPNIEEKKCPELDVLKAFLAKYEPLRYIVQVLFTLIFYTGNYVLME